ncbi:RHS repeat domain-containing protein [Pedobacter africanus]|uniref:RHS repeat-associated core domain-containing protein n=1 Tax=Pedobacter africanus TaxID=151894 RepID=A0A1W2EGV1_9SPHI|nr:DUF6443 domain-containing protein [Pedobacter africanus]SMD08368.1 RHS repeat-associated core domain-containing protein [Pedobacter africanus]
MSHLKIKLVAVVILVLTQFRLYAQQHVVKSSYHGESEITASGSITFLPGFHVVGNTGFRAYIKSTAANCIPLVLNPSTNLNYITTLNARVPGIKTAGEMLGKNICEVSANVAYMDGFGREIQSVNVQGNSEGKDVVQFQEFNVFGETPKQYLPFVAANNNGAYIQNVVNAQLDFYTNTTGITASGRPFAETKTDNSPLGRIIEQGAVGDVWQLENGHTKKIVYHGNNEHTFFDPNTNVGSRQVAMYTCTANSTIPQRINGTKIYARGVLTLTIYKDENWAEADGCWGTVEEYTDRIGRLILKRAYNKLSTGKTEMLSTYYVYDEFNNLKFVIPPKAEPDNENALDQNVVDNLCFQYRYDEFNRLVEKKTPGKGWEFMVYNTLNQMVFSQDALQRNKSPQEWSFSKHDVLGRNVMTGIYKDPNTTADNSYSTPSNANRLSLQVEVNSQSTLFEERSSVSITGYTSNTLPGTVDIAHYLSQSYYDDYDVPGLPVQFATTANNYSKSIQGLPTVSRIAVLNNPEHMLWNINYYDDEARVVKSFAQHYLGSVLNDGNYDETTNTYNFVGEVLNTTRKHFVNGIEKLNIVDSYDIDHTGSLLSARQKINGGPEIILAKNEYNTLGQLKNKYLHSEDNGSTFLQNISYGYNQRGWLNTSSSSLFNMELIYDDDGTYGNYGAYNGNISYMRWGSNLENMFSYDYDKINRLTLASFPGMTEEVSYDKGGNISKLIRNNNTINYSYTNGTNQLQSVSGNGLNQINYAYDLNGNTVIDGSKQNINVAYNLLDLPKTVSGSQSLSYQYDASGKMLSKLGASGLNEYIHGIQYGNVSGSYNIDFVKTGVGRAVRQSDNTYRYQYDLTDQLGNVRVTFDKDPNTGLARRIQEDNYYAFGKRASVSPVSLENKYLYNGKDLQEELGEYDYGARFYNPEIARWNVVDPSAELTSSLNPYHYTNNNPVNYVDPDGRYASPIRAFFSWVGHGFQGGIHRAAEGSFQELVYGKWYVSGSNGAKRIRNGDGENTLDEVERSQWIDRGTILPSKIQSQIDRAYNRLLAGQADWRVGHYNEYTKQVNGWGGIKPNYFFEEMFIGGAVAKGLGIAYNSSRAWMGGSTVFGADAATMVNASRMVPEEGLHQVLLHGTGDGFIIDGVFNTPKQLARKMLEEGFERGTSVRLISCNTGVYGDGAAYQLSRYLKSPVIAPTNKIRILKGGEYEIYDNGTFRTFYNTTIK